jgi:hypothetical protein
VRFFRRQQNAPESGTQRGSHPALDTLNTPQNRDTRVIAWCLLAFIIAGLVGAGWYAPDSAPTSLLWSGACLGVGITIGFLFGIPRTLQSDHDQSTQPPTTGTAPESRANYSQRVNTNLEQISDWLTKILVGLTLTQLGNIGTKLGQAASYIAPGLGSAAHSEVFASALIVYFSVVGFMSGYLLTRLVLAQAFWRADTATRLAAVERAMGEVSRVSRENRVTADVTGALQFLNDASTAPDLIQNFVRKLEQHRNEFPLNRRANLVLARLYDEKMNRRDQAIRILNEFIAAKQAAGAGQDEDTAAALYNLACYYSLDSRDATGEAKQELQRKAVRALRAAFDKDRKNVDLARPDHQPPDTDLDPIRETDEFRQLLRDFTA